MTASHQQDDTKNQVLTTTGHITCSGSPFTNHWFTYSIHSDDPIIITQTGQPGIGDPSTTIIEPGLNEPAQDFTFTYMINHVSGGGIGYADTKYTWPNFVEAGTHPTITITDAKIIQK